MNLKHCCV